MLILNTQEVETNVVTQIQITEIINNPGREKFVVRYNKLSEDGEVLERSFFKLTDKTEIQAMYTELDTILAQGKSFEDASKELLYSKIAEGEVV